MPKRILIMGGARFIGRLLADKLNQQGHLVYVLNRGNFRDEYPENIQHLVVDRNNSDSLTHVLKDLEFDVVFDNNAYSADQIRSLLRNPEFITGKYIFTSSAAVYMRFQSDNPLPEVAADGELKGIFSPKVKPYALNKFAAEETIRAEFNDLDYTILRFPNVFGVGDFLGKLSYFFYRLKNGDGILLEKEVGKFSLLNVADAANVLIECMDNQSCKQKTINVADPQAYDYGSFFENIFGQIYSVDKLKLRSAKSLWKSGYFLPLAWGPEMDTSRMQNIFPHIDISSISDWGRKTLSWEISYFGDRMYDTEFRHKREIELQILGEI